VELHIPVAQEVHTPVGQEVHIAPYLCILCH
jgi:hypothetical protein